jgi:esterase
MHLFSETVEPEGSTPSSTVLFLHGILGQGANLKTLAKRLVQQRQDLRVVLVDLRGHGRSLGREPPDTLATAADDIVKIAQSQTIAVTALVGHSFGGKVALRASSQLTELKHLVMLDSNPGIRLSAQGSEGTVRVLELLERFPGPWANRNAFIEAFEREGQNRMVGQWLAMQLGDVNGTLRFLPDLMRIRSLLQSYFQEDLWSLIDNAKSTAMHLVVATRSAVYSEEDIAHAQRAAHTANVTVDLIDAGHWVHVDAFEPLVSLLKRYC